MRHSIRSYGARMAQKLLRHNVKRLSQSHDAKRLVMGLGSMARAWRNGAFNGKKAGAAR